jgi:hypothetical protein
VVGEHQLAVIIIKSLPRLAIEIRLGKMMTQLFLDHSNQQRYMRISSLMKFVIGMRRVVPMRTFVLSEKPVTPVAFCRGVND